MRSVLTAIALGFVALAHSQTYQIGSVDLFGQTGLDEAKIRAAITIHPGDQLTQGQIVKEKGITERAIKALLGKPPTDFNLVSFDIHGKWMLFIGIPGPKLKLADVHPAPQGSAKLPGNGARLYQSLMDRLMNSTDAKGFKEDDSKGYALYSDPQMMAIQLRMRAYALANDAQITAVIKTAGDVDQRRAATLLLGYARRSQGQLMTMRDAIFDPDETVRNNAVRALVVFAHADPKSVALLDISPIVDLASSGSWTDRNKGTWLLEALTQTRSPDLLALIRKEAMPALLEMASWTDPPHAASARLILGRLAGIDEKRLESLVQKGDASTILNELKNVKH